MLTKERHARSVVALKDLLLSVIAEPEVWERNDDLINALKAQGRLAKYHNNERDITACSLNTQKTTADDVLEGGFDTLDELRRNALAAIESNKARKKRGNKITKTGLNTLNRELEQKVTLLEQQNMLLVFLISELKSKALKYASGNETNTRALCDKEMREINAKIVFTGNAELIKQALRYEE